MSDPMLNMGTLAKWGYEPTCAEPYNFDCKGVRPTSRGGNYRLCWCAHNYTCDSPYHFRVDAGQLTLIGPSPLINSRTCVAGQTCAIDGLLGHFVQNGDRYMILDTCAHPEKRQIYQKSDKWGVVNVPLIGKSQYGWFDGYTNDEPSNGTSFRWGHGTQVITQIGRAHV
eukprot:TRINITY_DN100567_c0_g1_i1.p1 TRINITY_DN100567_c0_g1~~TRINITY_DN100567_c0_g1_i1.p1  ORF type:complete len:189 (-),score=8.02 TRINITY_DN100567_c0_g1_i1:19-525(-)